VGDSQFFLQQPHVCLVTVQPGFASLLVSPLSFAPQVFSEQSLALVASLRDRSGAEDCLFQPQGVCVDSTSRMLYVCDCNKRVTVYRYGGRGDSNGGFAYVGEFGSEGSGPGQVRRVTSFLAIKLLSVHATLEVLIVWNHCASGCALPCHIAPLSLPTRPASASMCRRVKSLSAISLSITFQSLAPFESLP
jgi:hypothetical protein